LLVCVVIFRYVTINNNLFTIENIWNTIKYIICAHITKFNFLVNFLCNKYRGSSKAHEFSTWRLSMRVITHIPICNQETTEFPLRSIQPFRKSVRSCRLGSWMAQILRILIHIYTGHSPFTFENGVLETTKGNYLRPLWNFLRRCRNYSKLSRNGFIRIEVGQIRRACHVSPFVLSRNARKDMRERERERERERKRERERETRSEFQTVWCQITSN